MLEFIMGRKEGFGWAVVKLLDLGVVGYFEM